VGGYDAETAHERFARVTIVQKYFMRRMRIYLTSTVAGLAGVWAVLWISSRGEQRQMDQYIERLRNSPPAFPGPQSEYGAVMGWHTVAFGPGLFTTFLAILVFTLVFYFLLRWQRSRAGTGESS
jgi:ABC-type spermidine/putrescine transport system permease subunit II